MYETPSTVKENTTEGEEITRKEESIPSEEINENVKVPSTSTKDVQSTESEFKTPEKNQENQLLASNVTERKTPEKNKSFDLKLEQIGSCDRENGLISTGEQASLLMAASLPTKEVKDTGSQFKTPEKNKQNKIIESETPEKNMKLEQIGSFDKDDGLIPTTEQARLLMAASLPTKEVKNTGSQFKTPEKNKQNKIIESETPEKNMKLEQIGSFDKDDGLISTTEQARLLIAASRTPSKSINKTPVKQNTPTGKRSLENSPVTPGKHRRVELITLASPKAKRIKQI